MTQSIRQSDLFSGESWLKIYQAFTNINFNAYDFETIRAALVNYIRENFSENFNDWINSSELVAYIDLVAYLGQSLAYRMDINARENFIDVAERKESILRIAQMLSYKPRRNLPATGLLRIESITTNDDVYDSFGKNLNGINIIWNDQNNSDWFEHFILIMNNAMSKANPFGKPVDRKQVNREILQLYEFDSANVGFGVKSFNSTVDGYNLSFDVVSCTLDSFGFPVESPPRPDQKLSIIYRNDKNGFSSFRNGFFMLFKEGSLNYQDFRLDALVENLILDIDVSNINETDVWVHSIDDSGFVLEEWKKVPAIFGSNVIFNSFLRNERNLFEVITRADDKISIRFGDNKFANIPFGLLRVFYRVSSGLQYTINQNEIQNITLVYQYRNKNDQIRDLILRLSLLEPVSNSVPSEGIEEIRRNAPRVYYTQNRMVNGEDYNVFPLSTGNALKVSAVNRVYSGQSRFFDLYDPTSKYRDVNVFGDDGILYTTETTFFRELNVSDNVTEDDIIFNFIQPFLLQEEIKIFLFEKLKNNLYFPNYSGLDNPSQAAYNPFPNSPILRWRAAQNLVHSTNGYFYIDTSTNGDDSNPQDRNIPVFLNKDPAGNIHEYFSPGTMLQFDNNKWVTILDIKNNGLGLQGDGRGTVFISESINMGSRVTALIPPLRRKLNQTEVAEIKNIIQTNPQRFALYWNWYRKRWQTYLFTNETPQYESQNFILLSHPNDLLIQNNRLNGWVVLVNFNTSQKPISLESRGTSIVFESEKTVRFYFPSTLQDGTKRVFEENGEVGFDRIKILEINPDSSYVTIPATFDSWNNTKIQGIPIQSEHTDLLVYSSFTYSDGYREPRRVKVTYFDSDFDGYPDNPSLLEQIIKNNSYVFWERSFDQYGYQYWKPKLDVRVRQSLNQLNPPGLDPINQGEVVFILQDKKFYVSLIDGAQLPSHLQIVEDREKYVYKKGRAKLYFQWKHFSTFDDRIDPAPSNIIDIYVLDREYDRNIRIWNESGNSLANIPQPPSSLQLKQIFGSLENFKMISDQIIFHPVKYRLLYGSRAEQSLQGKFLVTKIKNVPIPDGEIKTRVVSAINEYFQATNWDFGQTVFFSELAAFIHLRLSTVVASVRLVSPKTGKDILSSIKMEMNEMPLSVATVEDIEIISM